MRTTISIVMFSLLAGNFAYDGQNDTHAEATQDRLVKNVDGHSWQVYIRNFDNETGYDYGISLELLDVTGIGQTNDSLTYTLTIKYDFLKDTELWDESRTQTYVGSGTIESMADGRIVFQLVVDSSDGTDPTSVAASFHPGNTAATIDDRIVLNLPQSILGGVIPPVDPCGTGVSVLEDGPIDLMGL